MRLERRTPYRDPLFAYYPVRLADGLEQTRLFTVVYVLHFPEQSKWRSELIADRDERRNVFWKTGAAVSDSSIQEIASDTVIHPDPVSHFFHIGSACFANPGHRVNVGNFQG